MTILAFGSAQARANPLPGLPGVYFNSNQVVTQTKILCGAEWDKDTKLLVCANIGPNGQLINLELWRYIITETANDMGAHLFEVSVPKILPDDDSYRYSFKNEDGTFFYVVHLPQDMSSSEKFEGMIQVSSGDKKENLGVRTLFCGVHPGWESFRALPRH
jgi:hypothetical protein